MSIKANSADARPGTGESTRLPDHAGRRSASPHHQFSGSGASDPYPRRRAGGAAQPLEKKAGRIALAYAAAATFCVVFAFIYEIFSHGVYSKAMILQFLYPLVLGCVPFALIARFKLPLPTLTARQLWALGIAALTVGSCFLGVLEIFGTTSRLSIIFFLAGAATLCAAAIAQLLTIIFPRG